jgi:hypothetical protein
MGRQAEINHKMVMAMLLSLLIGLSLAVLGQQDIYSATTASAPYTLIYVNRVSSTQIHSQKVSHRTFNQLGPAVKRYEAGWIDVEARSRAADA